jgi:hypothetical protein
VSIAYGGSVELAASSTLFRFFFFLLLFPLLLRSSYSYPPSQHSLFLLFFSPFRSFLACSVTRSFLVEEQKIVKHVLRQRSQQEKMEAKKQKSKGRSKGKKETSLLLLFSTSASE